MVLTRQPLQRAGLAPNARGNVHATPGVRKKLLRNELLMRPLIHPRFLVGATKNRLPVISLQAQSLRDLVSV